MEVFWTPVVHFINFTYVLCIIKFFDTIHLCASISKTFKYLPNNYFVF